MVDVSLKGVGRLMGENIAQRVREFRACRGIAAQDLEADDLCAAVRHSSRVAPANHDIDFGQRLIGQESVPTEIDRSKLSVILGNPR
ncbi:MAG: hypothetical protein HOP95_04405 [Sphingomonas sp.]|nr:hypothetical protein [Sphingomonas sp.]